MSKMEQPSNMDELLHQYLHGTLDALITEKFELYLTERLDKRITRVVLTDDEEKELFLKLIG